jgi:hypothetical protein
MYSVYFKKDFAKRFHPSKFDIRYSIFCGSLFKPPLAAGAQSDRKKNRAILA